MTVSDTTSATTCTSRTRAAEARFVQAAEATRATCRAAVAADATCSRVKIARAVTVAIRARTETNAAAISGPKGNSVNRKQKANDDYLKRTATVLAAALETGHGIDMQIAYPAALAILELPSQLDRWSALYAALDVADPVARGAEAMRLLRVAAGTPWSDAAFGPNGGGDEC